MKQVEAVIFDMDGTLIDSEVLWIEAVGAALRDRGVQLPHRDVHALVYGRAWTDIFRDIQRRFPGVYRSRKEMESFTEAYFSRACRERNIAIQPSVDLLRELGRRFPLAIVSGSTRRRIAETIRDLDIESLVDTYLGCEDVPAGKPDPSGFLMAAETLGVPPPHCLVFEDSAAGVQAAKAANMMCVALVPAGSREEDLGNADMTLTSLADFAIEACGSMV